MRGYNFSENALAEVFLVAEGCQFIARAPLHENLSLFVLSQKQSHDRYHSCPK
jgi:hypothetical protein